MELLPEPVQAVLAVAVLVFMGLGWYARRNPVEWVQVYDLSRHLTPAQKARLQHRQRIAGGLELILLGLAIPLGYVLLEVMTFSDPTAFDLALGWRSLAALHRERSVRPETRLTRNGGNKVNAG